jgi:hypothetical protein
MKPTTGLRLRNDKGENIVSQSQTKQKRAKAKDRRPRFENFISHPGLCDMRRPIKPEAVDAMIEKGLEAHAKIEEMKAAYLADSTAKEVKIPQSVYINLNAGIYGRGEGGEWDKAVAAHNAWTSGEPGATNPKVPMMYQPFRVELANLLNCRCVVTGHAHRDKDGNITDTKPKGWDDNLLGAWDKESGDQIVDPIRRCHPRDVVALLVDHPDQSVVKLNGVEYVVGDGSKDGSYPFIVHNSEDREGSTNYGAAEKARNAASLATVKNLVNMVGRVNNKGGQGWTYPEGNDATFLLPRQFITPGFLMLGDDVMTPAQIRKAAASENADDRKGIKFVAISQNDEAYRGKPIPANELWQAAQKLMDKEALAAFKAKKGEKDAAQRCSDNLGVQCRVIPDGMVPLGFRAACIGVIPFRWTDESKALFYGTAIGDRTNAHLTVTQRGGLIKEVAAEKKAPKKAKAPKAAKPKAPKARKPKVKDVEAAPVEAPAPVEVNAEAGAPVAQ